MRRIARVFFGCTFLAVLTAAGAAGASKIFPQAVKDFTGDPNPDLSTYCVYCHTSPGGGFTTANTAFGKYMRSRGLVAGDKTSLRNALSAAQQEPGEGQGYMMRLAQGLNPNPDAGLPPPDYGCGAHVAPRPGTALAAPLFFTALGLGALRRRNRRRLRMASSGT